MGVYICTTAHSAEKASVRHVHLLRVPQVFTLIGFVIIVYIDLYLVVSYNAYSLRCWQE
jgi:hypothetical protein